MSLERIIITFEQDGSFRGASATDFGGLPVDLTKVDLAKIIPDLNTAALVKTEAIEATHAEALAAKDAEIAALTAEKDAHYINDIEDKMQEIDELKALLTAAQAETQGVYQFRDNLLQMLASGADPLEVAKEALGTLEDKRRAAAIAQIEELTAQANALKAELGIE